jgi:hypothetical protein
MTRLAEFTTFIQQLSPRLQATIVHKGTALAEIVKEKDAVGILETIARDAADGDEDVTKWPVGKVLRAVLVASGVAVKRTNITPIRYQPSKRQTPPKGTLHPKKLTVRDDDEDDASEEDGGSSEETSGEATGEDGKPDEDNDDGFEGGDDSSESSSGSDEASKGSEGSSGSVLSSDSKQDGEGPRPEGAADARNADPRAFTADQVAKFISDATSKLRKEMAAINMRQQGLLALVTEHAKVLDGASKKPAGKCNRDVGDAAKKKPCDVHCEEEDVPEGGTKTKTLGGCVGAMDRFVVRSNGPEPPAARPADVIDVASDVNPAIPQRDPKAKKRARPAVEELEEPAASGREDSTDDGGADDDGDRGKGRMGTIVKSKVSAPALVLGFGIF